MIFVSWLNYCFWEKLQVGCHMHSCENFCHKNFNYELNFKIINDILFVTYVKFQLLCTIPFYAC